MKKFLPIALLLALLMVACVWTISWFAQARHVRQWIEANMQSLPPTVGAVQAASITTSGFPTRMIVTITNPRLMLNMKPALAQLHKYSMAAAGNSAGVLTTPDFPDSTLQYALSGKLTLALNALSNELTMEYAGGDTLQLTNAESTLALATDYSGANSCRVRLKQGAASLFSTLWDMQKFFSPEAVAAELRGLDCELPGSITTNVTTGQVTSSLGASHVRVTNDTAGGQSNVAIDVALKDYEVMPAGDEAMNRLRRAMTPVGESFTSMSVSLYGKQSLSVIIALTLPADMKMADDKPVRVDLKHFELTSDAGHAQGSMLFAANPQGGKEQGEIGFNFTSEFTPRQADIVRANMGRYLREFRTNPQFAQATAGADQMKLEAALFEALPDLSTLGPLTQHLALTYAFEKDKKAGSVNLSALEVSTRDYGVSASGQGSVAEGQPLPSAQANLTCKNCLAMVDVLGSYLTRLEAAAIMVSPANAGSIAFTPEQVAGVKQWLQAVGTPSGRDLQFAIVSDGGALTINGKPLAELMQLAQQYMNPKPR